MILPKELLGLLRVKLGDTIDASEAPGGVRSTPCNSHFEPKMAAAEKTMRQGRDILHVLIKS